MSARNRPDRKAARRAERAARDAASAVPVHRAGRPGPRADAIIRAFLKSLEGASPAGSCPHLDMSRPLDGQPHAYWAAGDPLVIRCPDCLQRAAPVPDACDHCGAAAPDAAVTVADAGGMTMRVALCRECEKADRAGVPL